MCKTIELTIQDIDNLRIVSNEFKQDFKSFINKGFKIFKEDKYPNKEYITKRDKNNNILKGYILQTY